jgi:hypothetical protein
VFSHFVALPPPNIFSQLATQPALTEVRFTTDSDGDVLLPMDYSGTLLRVSGTPIPLLARATTNFEAFSGSGVASAGGGR